MAITWIVTADSARAKVLQVADRERSLAEIENELSPERVGDYLEEARTQHRYDRLYLVAPPTVIGELRRQLGKEVEKLVCDELDKDLYRANARELEAYFLKGSGRAP
jgi:protein required for attachment to host cells